MVDRWLDRQVLGAPQGLFFAFHSWVLETTYGVFYRLRCVLCRPPSQASLIQLLTVTCQQKLNF